MNQSDYVHWILPFCFAVAGLLGGLIFEKLLLPRLKALVASSSPGAETWVMRPLHGIIFLLIVLAGFYAAAGSAPIPERLANFILKFLEVVAIISVTVTVARVIVGFLNLYTNRVEGMVPSTITTNIARAIVLCIGFLIILQGLNVSITPILTALGVGGLAVALALQDTLSNLFSGIYILASRQVRVGDFVRLDDDQQGYVSDIRWRHTTVRALPNNMIIIPNSKLASAIITNYYQPEKEMSVVFQVGVAYDSDLEVVERVTIDTARATLRSVEGGIPDFEPFIRYHTFADFSINFSVILRVREFTNQYLVSHEFVKRLHHAYRDNGIQFPFPTRTVYMHLQENSKHFSLTESGQSGR